MTDTVTPALQDAFDRERRDGSRGAADETRTVRMFGRLAALQAEVIAEQRVDIACKRGCSYCCHLRVEIRPHEAFVLARHIQSRFSAERQMQVVARLAATLQRIAPMSAAQHIRAGIACALLEDGACSAYEGRPATCRKYYSVSVATCRNAFADTAAPLTGELVQDELHVGKRRVIGAHGEVGGTGADRLTDRAPQGVRAARECARVQTAGAQSLPTNAFLRCR
jgi:hypothetical protein